ncbi:hypothetical protein ES703_76545 [subsurface metagenome]
MIILCELVNRPVDTVILIVIFFVLIWLVGIVIIRWIFRINEQIELLTQIKDELQKLRFIGAEIRKYQEKKEVEK